MHVGIRLDKYLHTKGYFESRSKAEEAITLGEVIVNKKQIKKPSYLVTDADKIKILTKTHYVSRAALKLLSVSDTLGLVFKDKVVLDIGSSTGGFTQVVLENGATKVIAVDVGTDQLHHSLRGDQRVEVYEKTDIRSFAVNHQELHAKIDIAVADVSFISLTKLLKSVVPLMKKDAVFAVMCKPQFEATKEQVNKGVIKNSAMRRQILKDFEAWLVENGFRIQAKADSRLAGSKGNLERFYKLSLNSGK